MAGAIAGRQVVRDAVGRDELHYAIVFWIEHTYNRRRRRQRSLGRLTPVEYELAFAPHEAATAA